MATELERTQIAVLNNDMKQVKADISELKINQAAGFASLETKLEAQDKKYASKLSEQLVYGLVALILIAVMTALLALVIIPATKKPQQQNAGSTTTTVNTPSGSTSTTTPSGANATANSKSDTATPSDSQTSSSNGGVQVTAPKLP